MLILTRASNSRLSGEWADDDYDVFDGDRHRPHPVDLRCAGRSPLVLDDHGAGAAVPA
jgi:hypothetical protein